MGFDANTQIWLGVKAGPDGLNEVLRNVPDSIYDELEDNGETKLEGLKFRLFRHADEPMGFGVELLDHGWRNSAIEVNLSSLSQEVNEMRPKVKKVFVQLGITVEPKLWLATHLP